MKDSFLLFGVEGGEEVQASIVASSAARLGARWDVIRFCRALPRTEEARVIGRQLLRSGTAVGAHYRAACRRKSDADFVNKLAMTLEEADESGYWLELLIEGQIVALQRAARLVGEAEELTRIFSAS